MSSDEKWAMQGFVMCSCQQISEITEGERCGKESANGVCVCKM